MSTAIRDEIKALMRRVGWTQYRLAMASGCTQSQLSRFFHRKGNVLLATAERLRAILEAEVVRHDNAIR